MQSDSGRQRPLAAVILAAGKGTRMTGDLPKVLHAVAGKPMVAWVIDAVRKAGADRVILVIGHGAEEVRNRITGVEFVTQEPQLGTGHAAICCNQALEDFNGDVLILGGDGPLLRAATINAMMNRHKETDAAATLATSTIPDPTGYGRIVRDGNGQFAAIVEHRNATPEQLEIHEIYPSYAVFDKTLLFNELDALAPNALSGEYYLTEIPAMLREDGHRVEVVDAVPPEDVLSINTPEQLAEVESILMDRLGAVKEAQ